MINYKHYVRIDNNNFIIKGFSDLFETPLETDICICESGRGHFTLFGETNPSLIGLNNFPKYKYINNEILPTTGDDYLVFKQSIKRTITEQEKLSDMVNCLFDDYISKQTQL